MAAAATSISIVNGSTPNSHPERESSVIFEDPFGARLLGRLAILRDDDVTLVVTHSRRHVGHQRRRRLRWDAVERLLRAHQRVCLQSKHVLGFIQLIKTQKQLKQVSTNTGPGSAA